MGGGVIYSQDPVFSPLHQNYLDFFWNASVTFPRNLLATEPQQNFSHISYCRLPQILVGNEGHPKVPDGEKAGLKRNWG